MPGLHLRGDRFGHDGKVRQRRLMGCELNYLKPDIGNINISDTDPFPKTRSWHRCHSCFSKSKLGSVKYSANEIQKMICRGSP